MTELATNPNTNPVLTAEFRYQRFVIDRGRVGRLWIVLAALMVVPSILITIGYTVGVLFNLLPPVFWSDIPQSIHGSLTALLFVVNISMYTVVTLVTMGLSNGSIRREKTNHTWSLLRLTPVDNRRIVFGKWWASLWALNGDHGMVIFLRIGLLAVYLGVFLPSQHALNDITAPYVLYFIVTAILVLIHGALDAGLSAILGIAGALPNESLGIVGTFATMVTRLLLAIGVAVWFGYLLFNLLTSLMSAVIFALWGILLTGALLLALLWLSPWLIDNT
ncbi:MAG: hypothetical protein AAFN11_17170 [Chloroflexota bacterium]